MNKNVQNVHFNFLIPKYTFLFNIIDFSLEIYLDKIVTIHLLLGELYRK